MKRKILTILILIVFFNLPIEAQRRGALRKLKSNAAKNASNKAVVVDERLAVLRARPSLYARPIQRMRGGREITIGEKRAADGVTFYRVTLSAKGAGWVQADAIAAARRAGDDARLARLVYASEGFDRIERAAIFLELFPASQLRPPVLLLFGDLIEEEAAKLSGRATRNLDRREMAASGAPLHSFYLNYPFLDRYRRLGVVFLFNLNTKNYHYDGATWKEIVKKFPNSPEVVEAQKRLAALGEKLEKK